MRKRFGGSTAAPRDGSVKMSIGSVDKKEGADAGVWSPPSREAGHVRRRGLSNNALQRTAMTMSGSLRSDKAKDAAAELKR
jgi:hypothetical protein